MNLFTLHLMPRGERNICTSRRIETNQFICLDAWGVEWQAMELPRAISIYPCFASWHINRGASASASRYEEQGEGLCILVLYSARGMGCRIQSNGFSSRHEQHSQCYAALWGASASQLYILLSTNPWLCHILNLNRNLTWSTSEHLPL